MQVPMAMLQGVLMMSKGSEQGRKAIVQLVSNTCSCPLYVDVALHVCT